jgi:hypothetical protein
MVFVVTAPSSMSERPGLVIRWRWAYTAAAVLMLWNASWHTARHDVTGLPVPVGFVPAMLWIPALIMVFIAVCAWVGLIQYRRQGH